MIMSIIERGIVLLFSLSFIICTGMIIQNQCMMRELEKKQNKVLLLNNRSKRLVNQLENQSRLLDELTNEMLKKLKDAYHETQEHGVARTEIIEDLKQLDEPQKKIIPKCADEVRKE
ncbi:hypothetical protein CRM75_01360 [Enterococcus faecium]|nr:hypothetical protein CRM75_01360 [Enterococcus faecium]